MALLLLYLAISLVFSFLCSIAEAVLLSVNRGYIHALKENRPTAAERLRRFRDNPEEPLAAILTLNTIAHTVGAAGVGHQAAVVFGDSWLGLTSAVLTLLILVFSEIVPKTLGTVHWRRLAPLVGFFVKVLVFLLYPIIVAMRGLTDKLSHTTSAERSRDEVESTILLAAESEHLSQHESSMLAGVLSLRLIPVKKIMTPRVVVFAVAESLSVADYLVEHAERTFSRIPLFDTDADNITGYVLRSSIFGAAEPAELLSSLRRDIPSVFETANAGDVYEELMAGNHHIAVVINEFGGTSGIVTLEDILETMVGHEIIDELDPATDMRQEAREKHRARLPQKGS